MEFVVVILFLGMNERIVFELTQPSSGKNYEKVCARARIVKNIVERVMQKLWKNYEL